MKLGSIFSKTVGALREKREERRWLKSLAELDDYIAWEIKTVATCPAPDVNLPVRRTYTLPAYTRPLTGAELELLRAKTAPVVAA